MNDRITPSKIKASSAALQAKKDIQKLFGLYPKSSRKLRKGIMSLVADDGNKLGKNFLNEYGVILAGVLQSEVELQELTEIIEDAKQARKQSGDLDSQQPPMYVNRELEVEISSLILTDYAKIKSNLESLSQEFFKESPLLSKMFKKYPQQALRILCFDDNKLKSSIKKCFKSLELLIKDGDDVIEFVFMLSLMVNNKRVNHLQLLGRLQRIQEIIKAKSGIELFLFMQDLIVIRKDLKNINSRRWLTTFENRYADFCIHKFDKKQSKIRAKPNAIDFSSPQPAGLYDDWPYDYPQPYDDSGYATNIAQSDAMSDIIEYIVPLVTMPDHKTILRKALAEIESNIPTNSIDSPIGSLSGADTKDIKQCAAKALDIFEVLNRYAPNLMKTFYLDNISRRKRRQAQMQLFNYL